MGLKSIRTRLVASAGKEATPAEEMDEDALAAKEAKAKRRREKSAKRKKRIGRLLILIVALPLSFFTVIGVASMPLFMLTEMPLIPVGVFLILAGLRPAVLGTNQLADIGAVVAFLNMFALGFMVGHWAPWLMGIVPTMVFLLGTWLVRENVRYEPPVPILPDLPEV